MSSKPPVNDRTEFLPNEVGTMLGISRDTVLNRIKAGVIPAKDVRLKGKKPAYRVLASWLAKEYPDDWQEMKVRLAVHEEGFQDD